MRLPYTALLSGAALALLLVVPAAEAQEAPRPPDADATMRFGPLSLKSTIALSNMGVDTNVFNSTDADQPQSDFTLTFSPTTDVWLRLGRTWLSGTIDVDWVYYKEFASERGANSTYRLGVSRTFNRLALNADATRLNTRERPGFEIDARSQRLETTIAGDAQVRVFSRTFVGVRASRRRHEFDRAAIFRSVTLADELNRTTTATTALVRQALTPLTTVGAELSRERERFATAVGRDSDSTRFVGTVAFEPLALVTGSAHIGVRRFSPRAADVPRFNGVTMAANLTYTVLGSARLGFEASRDVQPSFDFMQPYYLESGVGASVRQQVYGPFDVLARLSHRSLDYRDRIGARAAFPDRVDRVRAFGIGMGYRLGTDRRVGFTLDHQRRGSDVRALRYSGLRFGMSLTYET